MKLRENDLCLTILTYSKQHGRAIMMISGGTIFVGSFMSQFDNIVCFQPCDEYKQKAQVVHIAGSLSHSPTSRFFK